MIQDNAVTILGWIQYEKVKWLQTMNPEVPGLVYKLSPMDEKSRQLSKVRELWNLMPMDSSQSYIINSKHVIKRIFIPFGQVRNFIEKEIKGKLFIKS